MTCDVKCNHAAQCNGKHRPDARRHNTGCCWVYLRKAAGFA